MQHRMAGASAARADALYQIAQGLAATRGGNRPYRDLRLSVGVARDQGFQPALSLATGTPDLAFAVARGELDVVAVNPSAFMIMAYRGTGPFSEPLPIRALAVMPSWDRMAFAVSEKTGLTSLAELRERRYPLQVSIRRNPAHATRFVVDEVLAAEGFSLKDIESWGGGLHYVDAPSDAERLEGMANGTINAVFDEGIKSWGRIALDGGMRFLPLGAKATAHLEALGWPVGPIPPGLFPSLKEEITGASFSGWPIFVRADLADETVYQMAKALDEAKDQIAWDVKEPVTLADLCNDTDAAPVGIPFHPGAERYYHEHGAL
jgi:TRAP-type uncharacterized transport system substrate-binding protein